MGALHTRAKRILGRAARVLALTALWLPLACDPAEPRGPATLLPSSQPDEVDDALARLRQLEQHTRASTDFTKLPPAERASGPDPVRIQALSEGRTLVLLRGTDQLLLLAQNGDVLASVATPAAPRALAWLDDAAAPAEVWVAASLDNALWRYRLEERTLRLLAKGSVLGATALTDVVAGPHGWRYGLDGSEQRLISWRQGSPSTTLADCRGARRVRLYGPWLVASCLYDHRLLIGRLGPSGELQAALQHIEHDGPIWSFAARQRGEQLELWAGGIEDHPLDRSGGFFGHIDSYLFHYQLSAGQPPQRRGAYNLSALDVVTPKALAWLDDSSLLLTGYGGEHGARIELLPAAPARFLPFPLPPGSADISVSEHGHIAIANPLLDAIVRLEPWRATAEGAVAIRLAVTALGAGPDAAADDQQRWLGEALAFTTLMAPENPSDGAHSKFSCEACHFEGHIDGRIHHTGRDDVRASTKPLRGLFNNKPHFTRALDPDLTRVCHAEFRVAGSDNGHNPWFSITSAEHDWLLRRSPAHDYRPEQLRTALLRYLMTATHASNARALSRAALDNQEQRGLALFAQHCTHCHAARLITDEPASEIPSANWPQLILSPQGPIVWASAKYHQTGVLPYVHHDGARPSSLRRIASKWPYFTNGSARSLPQVVAGLGYSGEQFQHQSSTEIPQLRHLNAAEQQDLLAFLLLL